MLSNTAVVTILCSLCFGIILIGEVLGDPPIRTKYKVFMLGFVLFGIMLSALVSDIKALLEK